MSAIQPSPPIIIDLESDDLYKILGCSKGDSAATIRKAYRKLAARFHPDHGGNRDQFQKIKRAYEILSDPEQRDFYDSTGAAMPAQHDLESKAQETATGVLSNVIDQAAHGMQSMEHSNLAKLATQVIESNISQFRQNRIEAQRVLSRYEAALKRLKRNGKGVESSPVGVVLSQKVDQERRKHAGMGIDIQVLEMALEIVRSYSYETDSVMTNSYFTAPVSMMGIGGIGRWGI